MIFVNNVFTQRVGNELATPTVFINVEYVIVPELLLAPQVLAALTL